MYRTFYNYIFIQFQVWSGFRIRSARLASTSLLLQKSEKIRHPWGARTCIRFSYCGRFDLYVGHILRKTIQYSKYVSVSLSCLLLLSQILNKKREEVFQRVDVRSTSLLFGREKCITHGERKNPGVATLMMSMTQSCKKYYNLLHDPDCWTCCRSRYWCVIFGLMWCIVFQIYAHKFNAVENLRFR